MENIIINDNIEHSKLIEIINSLAKKKKSEGLNQEEIALQKSAYAVYLKRIRKQFDGQLDNVKIKDSDGTLTPFKQYAAHRRSQEDTNNTP